MTQYDFIIDVQEGKNGDLFVRRGSEVLLLSQSEAEELADQLQCAVSTEDQSGNP